MILYALLEHFLVLKEWSAFLEWIFLFFFWLLGWLRLGFRGST